LIDHISKPFDESNRKAIRTIIEVAYKSIGKDNLQIFMFDNEEYEPLALNPQHSENLVTDKKTGSNHFYVPPFQEKIKKIVGDKLEKEDK